MIYKTDKYIDQSDNIFWRVVFKRHFADWSVKNMNPGITLSGICCVPIFNMLGMKHNGYRSTEM
jgi:hypothetical protein